MDQNQQEPPQTTAPESSVCSQWPRNPRNPQIWTQSEGEGGIPLEGGFCVGIVRGVIDPRGIFCSDFGALCQGWNVSSENGKREQ